MADCDVDFLEMAARLALRGHGGAEPNPLVGCVIVNPTNQHVVGWGYHRQYGGPHAEIAALQRAGSTARGATLYCTLEPCNHTGKTPPCTEAVIKAGIKRVVFARRDPHALASGGMETLRAAGIDAQLNVQCSHAIAVSDPFVHRVRTGLPWIIAKWAQTLDGKIATRPPHCDSKWISNDASRRMVHRERGRVDAILTAIGTVLKDDPMLTARNVRARRVARRIIIDPNLQIPVESKLVSSAQDTPTIVICDSAAIETQARPAEQLRQRGVQIMEFPSRNGELPLDDVFRHLTARLQIATVLVEAGPGLMSRLFKQQLVNEAWSFIAPVLLGDEMALPVRQGAQAARITDGAILQLQRIQRRRGDIIARYRVS